MHHSNQLTICGIRCHLSTDINSLEGFHHLILSFVFLLLLHDLDSLFSGHQSIVQDVKYHLLYLRVTILVFFGVVPNQESVVRRATGSS